MSNLVHWRPHIADARKFREPPYACGMLTGNYAEFPQFRDHVTCPVCVLMMKDETNSAKAQPSAQTGVKGSVLPTTESVGGLAALSGSDDVSQARIVELEITLRQIIDFVNTAKTRPEVCMMIRNLASNALASGCSAPQRDSKS